MVSWTLSFELWFYLVFAALMLGSERRLPVFLLGWAAILLGYNLTRGVSENPYLHLILHPFALEFICGAIGALLWRSGRLQRLSSPCLVALIGAALLAAGPLGYHLGVHQAADLLRMLLIGLAFATLVTSCVLLEQRGQLRIPRLCSWIGDASYTIYLSHLLVLGVISFGWKAFGSLPNSLLDNAIAIGAALVAVVIYGLLAYRFFERPMVVWSNRLSRGWFRRPLPPAPRPV
ncbi:MAG: hypothetical protein GAK43_00672 [Stenotrophomonas maltophilia]|nr:MAG: hypothetical protein GAK43_00672 [Stenotrophomonas maltophilia]